VRRVVVTGLGFITSIGNGRAQVLESLRTQKSGIGIHPELDRPEIPVKLAGIINGFQFPAENPESWKLPEGLIIPRTQLRGMSPHGVYAYAAMREAIADAALPDTIVSNERTGMFCASAGSTRMAYRHVDKMLHHGIQRCGPMTVPSSIAGTLNFNLLSAFKIRGASTGFVSACSSSAHALGFAFDFVRQNRQDVMFVVGAEDGDLFTILPFASCRALSTATDPGKGSRPFDLKRDGFVATGGATVLVLEALEHAQKRGATTYAEAIAWGQSSDGYDIMSPEPNGEGLARAMRDALAEAQVSPNEIDYINAHATSTVTGDRAELRAIKSVFADSSPLISSTKSQTGHGLSLAGAMEVAFCCLALRDGFVPVSINITEVDPEAESLRIVTAPVNAAPKIALSNSSAFGGSNVSLVLKRIS
jgi:3-oxoacyl-[acyl-carrier-protein] synthase I